MPLTAVPVTATSSASAGELTSRHHQPAAPVLDFLLQETWAAISLELTTTRLPVKSLCQANHDGRSPWGGTVGGVSPYTVFFVHCKDLTRRKYAGRRSSQHRGPTGRHRDRTLSPISGTTSRSQRQPTATSDAD
jgi:hypothetical protein